MTASQDMERLARAAYEHWFGPQDWSGPGMHMAEEDYAKLVRAVLTELLNPSERMVDAGIHATDHDRTMGGRFTAEFTAAVKSILDQDSEAAG